MPGKKLDPKKAPKVFVSTTPAELILLEGKAVYQPVPGTSLQWVSNTESDVFRQGTTGTLYYLVAGRWFQASGPDGPWTFATPSLPEDFQKIPLEHPRSRVLASVPGTQQAAEAILLAQIPQTARVNKKEAEGARGQVPGRPGVQEDREDQGRSGRQHRQEHHQGRRSVLHVLRGRLVHGQQPDRPLVGDEQGAGRDLRDPDQLARPQRHLRDRRGRRRRVGHLRDRGHVHGRDGRVGLRRLGQRLVLPALLRRVLRRLSALLRPLPHLRLRRFLQPLDRRLRPRRGGLRPVRRRRRGGALQPLDRDLRARRRGLRTLWLALRGPGLQPAHRHLRPGAPGVERVRELGRRVRAARRPVGADGAGHEQPHRADHARHPHRQRRGRGHAAGPRRRLGRGSDRAAATSTPGATATSTRSRTAAGRNTTTDPGDRRTGPRNSRAPGRPASDSTTGSGGTHGHHPRSFDARRARPRREATSPWTSSTGTPLPGRRRTQRTNDYGSYQSSGGSRSSAGSYRSSGSRGGGGRRR